MMKSTRRDQIVWSQDDGGQSRLIEEAIQIDRQLKAQSEQQRTGETTLRRAVVAPN
jgi:hypothetical protein